VTLTLRLTGSILVAIAMLAATAPLARTSTRAAPNHLDCPFECEATDGSSTAGMKPNCAQFTAQVYNLHPGDHDWVLGEGPGLDCHTCTPCTAAVGFAWDFSACTTGYVVLYNECGVLLEAKGNFRIGMKSNCGDNHTHTFRMGVPNPNFDPSDCDAQPPFIGGPTYSITSKLNCSGCVE